MSGDNGISQQLIAITKLNAAALLELFSSGLCVAKSTSYDNAFYRHLNDKRLFFCNQMRKMFSEGNKEIGDVSLNESLKIVRDRRSSPTLHSLILS
jgi:hypothetical protein